MAGKELDRPLDSTAIVMGDVLPEVEDAGDIQRSIAARILQAPDVAGVFEEGTTIGTKDLVGVPLQVTSVRIVESQIEDSHPVYMLIEAVNMTSGELLVVNTSSRHIMAQLYQLKALGVMPVEVAVKEVAKARPGQSAPLGLEPIGETLKLLA